MDEAQFKTEMTANLLAAHPEMPAEDAAEVAGIMWEAYGQALSDGQIIRLEALLRPYTTPAPEYQAPVNRGWLGR